MRAFVFVHSTVMWMNDELIKTKALTNFFGEIREGFCLYKFIVHPHDCAVDKTNLSYIPGASIRDFESEVADLKALDLWVNKFNSLHEDLEILARQQA